MYSAPPGFEDVSALAPPPFLGLDRFMTDDSFDHPPALLWGLSAPLVGAPHFPKYPPPASEPVLTPSALRAPLIGAGLGLTEPRCMPGEARLDAAAFSAIERQLVSPCLGQICAPPPPPMAPPNVPKIERSMSEAEVTQALANFPSEVASRPTVLEQTNLEDGRTRLSWAVDAKKLDSQDKQHVSPQFEVTFEGHDPQTFQMFLYPIAVADNRRGAGFKKAKGRGRVVLKCHSLELPRCFPDVSFRVSIGSGELQQQARGPVTHNFSEQSCCGLQKRRDEWDFKSAVDASSKTVQINAEIAPARE